MKDVNTGGPAFPNAAFCGTRNEQQGMTLRDYFAAKAMHATIVNEEVELIGRLEDDDLYNLASDCYRMAKAMLKARES